MGLHPDSRTLLAHMAESVDTQPTVAAARAAEVSRHHAFDPDPESVLTVSRRTISRDDDDLSVVVYEPMAEVEGILVHFHGGGWTVGSPEVVDPQIRALANAGRCVVVSVDYRLAPEYPYPAGLNDAFAATTWAAERAEELGSDPSRVVVGGSSSGGNLAAAVTLMVRDRGGPSLAGQLLIYPALTRFADLPSRRLPADEVLISEPTLQWYWDLYLAKGADPSDPYVSPLLSHDLTGLPPAVVVTAEYDILRDEAEAYARRLADADIPVELRRYDGLLHAFLAYASIFEQAKNATSWIGIQLQRLFAGTLVADGS